MSIEIFRVLATGNKFLECARLCLWHASYKCKTLMKMQLVNNAGFIEKKVKILMQLFEMYSTKAIFSFCITVDLLW